ncbi:MAG TPA: hypothetical protein VF017_01735 [Thermoanaerobaculia bacterium]|nr:hypothetical protein [Thermoanaerobaculia bacterium]
MKPALAPRAPVPLLPLVVVALLGASALGCLGAVDPCRVSEPRSARLDAQGAQRLRVIAHAGGLRLQAVEGQGDLDVQGTACASSADLLARVRLETERVGQELVVRAVLPEGLTLGASSLDLTIEGPPALALTVEDGSGVAEVAGFASLRIDDGSGDLIVNRIAGDVVIVDGSGSISVEDVGGSLRLEDGSGPVEIARVAGDVEVEDGSGDLAIREAQRDVTVLEDGSGDLEVTGVVGNVLVRDDGSGSIRVFGVGGDFRVDSDGSGSIDFDRVAGRVTVPRR